MSEYHFTPETYDQMIAGEVPGYRRLQDAIAAQTSGMDVSRFLDLGVGTGVTARAVLAAQPEATIVGIDVSTAFDLPDSSADQLGWLAAAGFDADCPRTEGDLAVFSATKSRS